MRNERSISFVAIVVMLSCLGGVVGACPIATSNAHIASVLVHAHQRNVDSQVLKKLDAPEQTSSCITDAVVPNQIKIEEFQNLPPPAIAV